MKEFSGRFDSVNGKYLLIFVGVFARTVQLTHLTQVISLISQYITSKRIYDYEWCIRGQLNKDRGGGEIHEIKRRLGKTEIG